MSIWLEFIRSAKEWLTSPSNWLRIIIIGGVIHVGRWIIEKTPASVDTEVYVLLIWTVIGICVVMDVVREKFRDIRHKLEKSH